jgi:hypothetical protein
VTAFERHAASGIEPPTQRPHHNTNTQPLNAIGGRETATTVTAQNGTESRRRGEVVGSCGGDLRGGGGGFVLRRRASGVAGRPEVLKTGEVGSRR